MNLGILREAAPGERRVAMVPAQVATLSKSGWQVFVERGAGAAAGFPDAEYEAKGARLAGREEVIVAAACLALVNLWREGRTVSAVEPALLKPGKVLLGQCDPLASIEGLRSLAEHGVTIVALELIPRITRAQSMDVLSSMALIAGYKAVIWAAEALPKMFPLLMTAAGTLSPAKVFVVGAGVAGLQAIATARRLGALVEAYDVRPAARDEVTSMGAKFLDLPLTAAEAADRQGYAKAQGEEFLARQRELMHKAVAGADVVITTAAVPGKPAPRLVTGSMVEGMRPGSVIVDLAAERGGNCELTVPGESLERHGVQILGPLNVPSSVAHHASLMFSKNVASLLEHLAPQAAWRWDLEDEIVRETLVAREGGIVNPRLTGAPAST